MSKYTGSFVMQYFRIRFSTLNKKEFQLDMCTKRFVFAKEFLYREHERAVRLHWNFA